MNLKPKKSSGSMYPIILEPVVAKIAAVTDLGFCIYHEVVYHNGESWNSYAHSKTFDNGEQVKEWVYVKDCFGDE